MAIDVTGVQNQLYTSQEDLLATININQSVINNTIGGLNADGTPNIEGAFNITGVSTEAWAESRINIGNRFSDIFSLGLNSFIPAEQFLILSNKMMTAQNMIERFVFAMILFIMGFLNLNVWLRLFFDKVYVKVPN